jgi:hypothetical protein
MFLGCARSTAHRRRVAVGARTSNADAVFRASQLALAQRRRVYKHKHTIILIMSDSDSEDGVTGDGPSSRNLSASFQFRKLQHEQSLFQHVTFPHLECARFIDSHLSVQWSIEVGQHEPHVIAELKKPVSDF